MKPRPSRFPLARGQSQIAQVLEIGTLPRPGGGWKSCNSFALFDMAVLGLDRCLHCECPGAPGDAKHEPGTSDQATEREMKALFVLLLVLLAAATAVAYSRADVRTAVVSHTSSATEPTALLLSGSALLGLAAALRRLAS